MGCRNSKSLRVEGLNITPNDNNESCIAVTMLARLLVSSGAEATFIEQTTSNALRGLGVEGVSVNASPSRVDFTCGERFWTTSKVEMLLSVGMAESASRPLLDVARHPERYSSSWMLAQAHAVCNEGRLFPIWLQSIAWSCLGPATVTIFFQGNWASVLVAFLGSICTFLLAVVIPIFFPGIVFAAGFLGGFVASLIAKSSVSLLFLSQSCAPGVAVSSIIGLVPGVGITLGVLDVINGSLISGSSRLIGALFQAFLQGLGMVVGWHVAAWYNPPPLGPDSLCPNQVDAWFLFLFVPIALCGWCVLLDCRLRSWPYYWTSSLLSGGVSVGLRYSPVRLPSYAPVLIGSAVVGIYGRIVSRLTGLPSFGMVLIGVFNMLPGAASVFEAVSRIMEQPDVYAISVLQTAAYIATGLSFANAFCFVNSSMEELRFCSVRMK